MGSTCSQCTKNKVGDMEFGSNLSCYCDHGNHSTVTKACSDFSPMHGSIAGSQIPVQIPVIHETPKIKFMGDIKPEIPKPKEKASHDSGPFVTMMPILGYVVMIAVAMIIYFISIH